MEVTRGTVSYYFLSFSNNLTDFLEFVPRLIVGLLSWFRCFWFSIAGRARPGGAGSSLWQHNVGAQNARAADEVLAAEPLPPSHVCHHQYANCLG